ncbi:hypothetical protein CRM22_003049, partial [Opisthorchis felineus]
MEMWLSNRTHWIYKTHKLDRFCRLYLEQTLQDCQNEDMRMLVMNRLEGQKRLHSKTHLALSQV